MSLIDLVQARIAAAVPALAGRVEGVADLAAMVRVKALPQRMPWAYVIPLGFDAVEPDAATGLFRQMLRETAGVILIAEATGDAKAKRANAAVDALKDSVIGALAGYVPDGAINGFVPLRGRLLSVSAGTVMYQLDFALDVQLRIPR